MAARKGHVSRHDRPPRALGADCADQKHCHGSRVRRLYGAHPQPLWTARRHGDRQRRMADALVARIKEADTLQDINSCCEFLNTRDHIKKNIHGVVGFGMGGSLALRFACQRKRLRAAVAFYAKVTTPPTVLKDLVCPILYHRAGTDPSITDETWPCCNKPRTTPAKSSTFTHTTPPHTPSSMTRVRTAIDPTPTQSAWESTVAFLDTHVHAER